MKDQLKTLIIASEDASSDVSFRGEADCFTERYEQPAGLPLLESPDSDPQDSAATTSETSETIVNMELSVDRGSIESNSEDGITIEAEEASESQTLHCPFSSQLFHLGSQQLVRQLAKDMLYQQRAPPAWTWEPTRSAADETGPGTKRSSSSTDTSTAVPKAAEPVDAASEKANNTDGQFNETSERRNYQRRGSIGSPSASEDFVPSKTRTEDRMARIERLVEAIALTTKYPNLQGSSPSQQANSGENVKPAMTDGDDVVRRLGELLAGRQESMPGAVAVKDIPPIKFETPYGKKYTFPWDTCNTWKVGALPVHMQTLNINGAAGHGVFDQASNRAIGSVL